MRKIQGHRGIIIVFYRRIRVEQIVQRYLELISRICSQNQGYRFLFAAHNIARLLHRNKNQPLWIMIAERIINKILLNGGNLKAAYYRALRRRLWRRNRPDTAQRQQILMRRGVSAYDSP